FHWLQVGKGRWGTTKKEYRLVRPPAKELAVALNERITLKWRKALAKFVPLGLPHAHDRIGASVPEAIEGSCVVSKMVIQNCPLSSDRCFHGAKSLPLVFCCVLARSRTDGLRLG